MGHAGVTRGLERYEGEAGSVNEPKMVGDRYQLGRLLGYGGMAEVHLGRDVRLNRDVAIKVLRADLARDPSFQTRFRREAHSAGSLNHPNIVAVYDTGEDQTPEGAVPYIVMEYVDGRTLRDVLSTEGKLDPRRAMQMVAEVCGALDFSHRNGIIHRDIKPGNVMITKAGAVKVMDFGIARAVADGSATVTQTAAVIGTAQYLSPEQARGEAVDARSDVYSTGCLLYELLTGHPPFQGDSPVAVAYQHVRESAPVPSSVNAMVPREADSIVMKALAKNPLNRYQTAAEMRADLQHALANQPIKAEPVLSDEERTQFIARTPVPPIPPGGSGPIPLSDENEPVSRRGAIILAAVVVLLLAIIGGSAYLLLHDNQSSANNPKTVSVPDLWNLTPTAAADKLRAVNLVPDTPTTVTDDQCDPGAGKPTKGSVCGQDPAPNAVVTEGTTVKIMIAGGPAKVQVPVVTGISESQASQAVTKAGLVPVTKKVNQVDDPGQVVKQDPQPYVEVAPGSRVTIYVSTGKIKIPDVKGQTEDQARQTLNNAGFLQLTPDSVKVTTADQKLDGTVQRTNPAAGTVVTPDKTTVTLYVYQFQPPPPPSTSCSSKGPPQSGCSSSSSPGG
jgi:eukaryotic-like serine/threonine-protein kinase